MSSGSDIFKPNNKPTSYQQSIPRMSSEISNNECDATVQLKMNAGGRPCTPADQMRQAANRYHQELLKNYPGVRHSLSGMDFGQKHIVRKSSAPPEIVATRSAAGFVNTRGMSIRPQLSSIMFENSKEVIMPSSIKDVFGFKKDGMEKSEIQDNKVIVSLPFNKAVEDHGYDSAMTFSCSSHFHQEMENHCENWEKHSVELCKDHSKPIRHENTHQSASFCIKETLSSNHGVMETDLDALMQSASPFQEAETTLGSFIATKNAVDITLVLGEPIESSIDDTEISPTDLRCTRVTKILHDLKRGSMPNDDDVIKEPKRKEKVEKCYVKNDLNFSPKSSPNTLTDDIMQQNKKRESNEYLESEDKQLSNNMSLDKERLFDALRGDKNSHINTEISKHDSLYKEKDTLISSMQRKIQELCEQEDELNEEIKNNEELGLKVLSLVESKATQSELSKYELFIGELNKIVELLLSLTQRLHRYELMLHELDIVNEDDQVKRDSLVAKIEKLKSQHEEASYLRDINDKRGENVGIALEKYFTEEEYADFQYYIDMKSQLALMHSEIDEKVKLGQARIYSLERIGRD